MSLASQLRKLKKNASKISIFLVILALILVIYSNIRYDKLVSKLSIINLNSLTGIASESSKCLEIKNNNITKYLLRYPNMLDCKHEYSKWSPGRIDTDPLYNYSKSADKKLHDLRITRAIIFFFPIDKVEYFKPEFLWLYRSWINMINYEPAKWRTDIVFFTNYKYNNTKDTGSTYLFKEYMILVSSPF